MRWSTALAVPLLTAMLAGCASDAPVDPGVADDVLDLLYAGAPLYSDPQNTPHPAFNWPTLSHPANGTLPNKWWAPSNATDVPAAIQDLQHVVQTPAVAAGAGIAIFGSIAVVPGYGAPSHVVDISDPTAPVSLATFDSQLGSHRGAAFIAYPDGGLVVVISTGGGIDVWDLTDPTDPQPLPVLDDVGSHKVGVIPGTPIVVNARSSGGGRTVEEATGVTQMWDLSDPWNPARLPDFENGFACHHVYFWNDLEEQKFRGTCAGIEYTQIWDTTDPYNLSVIVNIPVHHGIAESPSGSVPLLMFSHYAGLSLDGKVLMVGDEHGGGLGPIGCVARIDTPAGSISTPIGAVWFYDVSDEKDPRFIGYISASQLEKLSMENPTNTAGVPSSCTAHHGRLVPVEGRDVLAMSFYGAGVVVVDFTDMRGEVPGLPTVVAQYADGSDTWETWYYNGYLFTGDLNRGMDILAFE